MPKRIQRKRTKGWRMPEGAIYVGRPTSYGNPFLVRSYGRDGAVDKYRRLLTGHMSAYEMSQASVHTLASLVMVRRIILENLSALKGRDLCCFCPTDKACHADVLLELANREIIRAGDDGR